MSAKSLAVLYAAQGGMGDVGKFVVQHALQTGLTVKPIALASNSTSEPSFDFEVDVKPAERQDELKAVFSTLSPAQIVVEDEDAQQQIANQIQGTDAVVACVGSRQPGYEIPALKARWCELGAKKVTAAMASVNIERIVILSSFGINDDNLPMSVIKVLWAAMLRTALKAARKDLLKMESHVTSTSLDYLIVRPTGLSPDAQPTGTWAAITSKASEKGKIEVSKSDVAKFMLEEAIKPTLSKRAVTVAGKV